MKMNKKYIGTTMMDHGRRYAIVAAIKSATAEARVVVLSNKKF